MDPRNYDALAHSELTKNPEKKLRARFVSIRRTAYIRLEHSAREPSDYMSLNVENDGAPYLGTIDYDEGLEESRG